MTTTEPNATQLAKQYKDLYPSEFGDNYNQDDHQRICLNWLARLPESLAMSNWAGKMSRAYCKAKGVSFPRTKSALIRIVE